MVWFSSAMDLKKLAFSDQFPYCVSPRRKVVSGFGLGVVASFIVLSVILLSVSFKAPFLNPMFQGFSSLGSSNTSFVSWPLSLSSTTGLSSSSTGTSSTTATNTTELQNSVDGNERVGKVKVVDQIHEANVSEIGKDGKYLDINGNGIVMEKTHVDNFSEKVENGSFTTEGGRIHEKTQKVNGEDIDKSANFSSSGVEGMVLENTHLGNFSEKVKNGSFIGGDVIAGEVVKRHANESSLGKYKIAENNNEGNRSYNEENVGSPSKVKASEINNGGISSGENNNTTSLDDSQKMHNGECDIFDGKWVRDGTKPYYPPGSCPYIGRDFDCHLNRRPDDWFLKWKWQPNGCGIPSLNATDFLERLRGKKLVFVGDSLNRNMWESLVCILRHSVRNKKKVYEISGRREFKKKGFYAFRFEDYNCTGGFRWCSISCQRIIF
ncbi:hypothetical protein F0562_034299 [Nyssa sinensis]|uniref:Uncharacterized protein n=1 Tax=Nyssa sinensis TaxID=561372 RepID=A0A5J5AKD9_9ASTE|nr:hypothetical protein F0562_034299 [Nyssa sinensis]